MSVSGGKSFLINLAQAFETIFISFLFFLKQKHSHEEVRREEAKIESKKKYSKIWKRDEEK